MTESRRTALAVANDLLALVGLLVLGFPVTASTIRTTAGNWTLIAMATMQLVPTYFRPQLCGARTSTMRARINDQIL